MPNQRQIGTKLAGAYISAEKDEALARLAIDQGALGVQYQPLFDLEPYRLSGFEALARWTHPERGAVSPAVFIALAEESGHIEALTHWVIDQAVGQLAGWRRAHPGMGAMHMHVNISGRDLANPALVQQVREVLLHHALPPGELTLEITETTLMGRLAMPSLLAQAASPVVGALLMQGVGADGTLTVVLGVALLDAGLMLGLLLWTRPLRRRPEGAAITLQSSGVAE